MKNHLGIVASLAIFSGVVLAFGLLDSCIVTAMGLSVSTSCMIHGALTAAFVLDNWRLLKDLEANEKIRENDKYESLGMVIHKTFFETLLRQNTVLERKNIELELRLKSHKCKQLIRRSWSLYVEPLEC